MEFLKDWVFWIYAFLREKLWGLVQPLLETVMDALPASDTINVSYLQSWFQVMNAWMPLTEFFVIWGTYTTFLITLISVKWILKIIPFVG